MNLNVPVRSLIAPFPPAGQTVEVTIFERQAAFDHVFQLNVVVCVVVCRLCVTENQIQITPQPTAVASSSLFQTGPEPRVHCELLVFGAGADAAREQRPRHAQRHLQQQRHCPAGARGRGCHQALQKGQSRNGGGRGHAECRALTPRQEIYGKICSAAPRGCRQASRLRPRSWSGRLTPQIFSHLLLPPPASAAGPH